MVADDPESFADLDGHGPCLLRDAQPCVGDFQANSNKPPKKAVTCTLCRIWNWFTAKDPDYDPFGKTFVNTFLELNNLRNRVAGAIQNAIDGTHEQPKQFPLLQPSSDAEASSMENLNFAFLFVPGFDVDVLAADLARGVKPVAQSKELQAIIDELYQPSDKIPGGTAGAVRAERTVGRVGGRTHTTKAIERAAQLRSEIGKGTFRGSDLALAGAIFRDLTEAVAGR
jgi:hypothetical protein